MIGIEAPLAPPKVVVPWFWLTSGASLNWSAEKTADRTFCEVPMPTTLWRVLASPFTVLLEELLIPFEMVTPDVFPIVVVVVGALPEVIVEVFERVEEPGLVVVLPVVPLVEVLLTLFSFVFPL